MIDIIAGQPIVLPDGTKILPGKTGSDKVLTKEEEQIEQELDDVLDDPYEDAEPFRRTLADITTDAKQFNPVMLVLAYSMWGLDASAIAILLRQERRSIEQIMESDLFITTRKQMLESIRYIETGAIHGYLATKALDAAKVVAKTLHDKDGDRKLRAAQDILDRTGFRPADRVEHVMRFEDELRIVHLQETRTPTIDVGFEEVFDAEDE